MHFPDHVDHYIREFAAGMGLVIGPAPKTSYTFTLQHSGIFTLTRAREAAATVASLTFSPSSRREDELPDLVLAFAETEWADGRLLHPAMSRGKVVLAVRIGDHAVSAAALDNCLHRLVELARTIG